MRPKSRHRFQFHEGPIKTTSHNAAFLARNGFNSMKVRLKPTLFTSLRLANFSFNSMKVRLKPDHRKRAYSLTGFQFHEGPIKTLFLNLVSVM